MLKYSIKRLLEGLLVLLMVSIITFTVLKIIPADPAVLILGTEASPESLEALRESMGLNQSYPVQYITWITDALRGDLGRSYYFGKEVSALIGERLPVTISLAVLSMTFTFLIAMILGIIAALKQDSKTDFFIRMTTQISIATPNFWLGMIALTYLAARWKLFPVAGITDFDNNFWQSIHTILLPSLVMSITQMGSLTRQFRSSMISALQSEYMLSTEIKGLNKTMSVFKYALRSAIITPITVAALQFSGLFGGTAVIETVFSLAGLGRLLVVSVEQRDMVLLQGIILFITTIVILISIFTDILYVNINKTIKLGDS